MTISPQDIQLFASFWHKRDGVPPLAVPPFENFGLCIFLANGGGKTQAEINELCPKFLPRSEQLFASFWHKRDGVPPLAVPPFENFGLFTFLANGGVKHKL